MKKIIRKLIYNFPIHLKNYIILESNPDLTDNTYSLFKILLKNKVNEKYKLFWFVDDKNMYKNINIKNVYFINAFGEINIFEKIKKIYINIKSKYIIDCNKLVYKKNINQKRLYLSHGMPYKLVSDYCNTIGNVDCFLSLSPFFDNIISEFCHVDKDNIIDLGPDGGDKGGTVILEIEIHIPLYMLLLDEAAKAGSTVEEIVESALKKYMERNENIAG